MRFWPRFFSALPVLLLLLRLRLLPVALISWPIGFIERRQAFCQVPGLDGGMLAECTGTQKRPVKWSPSSVLWKRPMKRVCIMAPRFVPISAQSA